MPTEWVPILTVFASIASTLGVAWLTGLFNKPVTEATARQQIPANAANQLADASADVATAGATLLDRVVLQLAKNDERLEKVEKKSREQDTTISNQADTIAVLETRQRKSDVKIQFLTDRVATLTTGVRILSSQVVEMGGKPRWKDAESGESNGGVD